MLKTILWGFLIFVLLGSALIIFAIYRMVSGNKKGFEAIDPSISDNHWKKEGRVYWCPGGNFFNVGARLIESADLDSFELMGRYYSKDQHHVYLQTEVLANADPATFERLDDITAKDRRHVFYFDKILQGVDTEKFQLIWGSYGFDETTLFYGATAVLKVTDDLEFQRIKNDGSQNYLLANGKVYSYGELVDAIAHPITFELLGGSYSKDNFYIYYQLEPVDYIDPESFKLIDDYFAVDKDHAFYQGKIIEGVKPENFRKSRYADDTYSFYEIDEKTVRPIKNAKLKRIGDSIYRTDGRNVYTGFSILKNVDADRFKVLGDGYGTDQINIYFNQHIIEGADVASFRTMKDLYSSDKNNVYFQQNKLIDADPVSFQLIENGVSRDSRHLYWHSTLVEGVNPNQYIYQEGDWAEETQPGRGQLRRQSKE